MDNGYKVKSKNPKKDVNFISKLVFGWMLKIVRKGSTKGLDLSDLYKPLDKDKSEILTDRLEHQWQKEIEKTKKKNSKPSFKRALTKVFFAEYMIYGILWFIYNIILRCYTPIIVGDVTSLYVHPYTEETKIDYYVTSTVLVLVILFSVFMMQHTTFALNCIGMRVRIASSALIYRKITRLSRKALGQTATGQIVNLLSNDVSRFDLGIGYIHSLWVMPIQGIVLAYFIWSKVGIASLAGVLSMAFVSLPVQIYIAKLMGNFRAIISRKTDKRVKLMSEIISGIQVIKMYAWEKSFEKIVKLARATEIKSITSTSYLKGIFASCMVILERSSLYLTILVFVLQGNIITADIVFSLAQAYNIFQLGMAGFFAWAISYGAETLISIDRLEEFLLLEEREESAIEYTEEKGVRMLNVNASWVTNTRTLGDIILEIPEGSLCTIVGPVGSGKSSLLQLLLGELPLTTGRVQMGGQVSYSSQDPWLFQSTVRNNILFGQPYNKLLYDKVVKVCALEQDFAEFPKGDSTVVGERGVSLSGGQRARINLARAVYRQADIYLLDDPLSAVDTHVGKHLFEECIYKYLKGKTRILVTHQLQYLKQADLIVVLCEGHIEAKGTFEELCDRKMDFTKTLSLGKSSEDKLEEVEAEMSLSIISSVISKTSDNLQTQEEDYCEEKSGNDPNSSPFKDYMLASNNICSLISLITLLFIAQASCAATDFWVAFWTNQEQIRHANNTIILQSKLPEMQTLNDKFSPQNFFHKFLSFLQISFEDIFDKVQVDNTLYTLVKSQYAIIFYGVLICIATILTLSRSFLFFKMCMMSSTNLHSNIFHSLMQTPMKFFNQNPSGRILNRVSKDIGAIDETLPRELLDAVQIFLVMCGILFNIAVSNQYTMISMVVLGALFLKMKSWYISTAKGLKHLESITKSPVFSHINSTINGIVTIRASKAEDIIIDEFDDHQNIHTSAWYLLIACKGTFGLWLDIICTIFVASICYSFIILHSYSDVTSSMVGLALAQSMVLTGMLQYGLQQTAQVINSLISVERVVEYTKLDKEGPFETPEDNVPKGDWPEFGQIDFHRLSLKYDENDPPVLKDLDFTIQPGEKIGIVGRTGAGKSSLITALFRLTGFDGRLFIDGEDIKKMGLTNLRKNISIIPQEPVLFSATVRYNLDPFGEFDDSEIWNALEQVDLKGTINSLDFMIAEGGGNFSLGQKQLICLARAVLRNNKILVLDEATANVDPRTDFFIQEKIREKFSDCTVLTIAHRLNTIMDSDKVLVMSFGKAVEFDHPYKLLQIPDGYFYKLVMETSQAMALELRNIAMKAYYKNATTSDSGEYSKM